MDLSPKLDTYQALTWGSIDKHSRLFSDLSYFKYVVGENTTTKVLKGNFLINARDLLQG